MDQLSCPWRRGRSWLGLSSNQNKRLTIFMSNATNKTICANCGYGRSFHVGSQLHCSIFSCTVFQTSTKTKGGYKTASTEVPIIINDSTINVVLDEHNRIKAAQSLRDAIESAEAAPFKRWSGGDIKEVKAKHLRTIINAARKTLV